MVLRLYKLHEGGDTLLKESQALFLQHVLPVWRHGAMEVLQRICYS